MGYNVGHRFTTGNTTVRGLANNTKLKVAAPGTLEITELPAKPAPKPGDRFTSKYGPATIVGLTSRSPGISGFDPKTQVLYIADGTNKVRFANRSAV